MITTYGELLPGDLLTYRELPPWCIIAIHHVQYDCENYFSVILIVFETGRKSQPNSRIMRYYGMSDEKHTYNVQRIRSNR